ncbi:MAG: hypothetical protein KC492_35345, partial [Myxococcales bacterium]|nr:hypothetical protein [Myxococcales bacterium]
MAISPVIVEVNNAEDVLRFYDRILIERSTTASTGPFTEITTPATRLAITLSQARYEYFDTAGHASYWYRSRYVNSLSGAQSDPGDAVPGGPDPALEVLSVQELKDFYLHGVDITTDTGEPLSERAYEHYI